MNANALDVMILPVIRGIFLAAMLGGAAMGLARMFAAIAACLGTPKAEAAIPRPVATAADGGEEELAAAGA